MKAIHDILNTLSITIGRNLLATIVHVEGSAYRKEGAMMLLTGDGERVGLLSGGCLESDVAARADAIWQEGVAQTIVYDLSAEDDFSWGQGNGCNGVVHVLLEPVDGEMKEHLHRLRRELDKGNDCLHVKRLTGQGTVGDYIFYAEGGGCFGEWDGEPPLLQELLGMALRTGMAERRHFSGDQWFVQRFEPRPRLVIFGAGPDVRPLVRVAAEAGFRVIVADWREALCNTEQLPEAQEWIVGQPDAIAAAFPFAKRDSVVVMTHHFQKDQTLLPLLLNEKLRYLGVLGSRRRAERLLGGAGALPDWLHAPVGLAIGAVGPEEIAISIIADLIKAARQRGGSGDCGHLFGRRREQPDESAQAEFANRG